MRRFYEDADSPKPAGRLILRGDRDGPRSNQEQRGRSFIRRYQTYCETGFNRADVFGGGGWFQGNVQALVQLPVDAFV